MLMEQKETLPILGNISIEFLTLYNTSKLQPLEAGIIAAMKVRHRRRETEHVVDLIETCKLDIFKIDIITAMRWLSSIWEEVTEITVELKSEPVWIQVYLASQ